MGTFLGGREERCGQAGRGRRRREKEGGGKKRQRDATEAKKADLVTST